MSLAHASYSDFYNVYISQIYSWKHIKLPTANASIPESKENLHWNQQGRLKKFWNLASKLIVAEVPTKSKSKNSNGLQLEKIYESVKLTTQQWVL